MASKVTLIRNVLHDGVTRLAGEVIEVAEDLKKELIGNNLAEEFKDVQEGEIVKDAKASK